MPNKRVRQSNDGEIVQLDAPFRAAVVAKDAMSSGLLADALTRNLNYEAIGTRPSDLLRELQASIFDLVIISADLGSKPTAGLELLQEVSAAHPNIPIVLMLNDASKDATMSAFKFGARGVFNRQMSMHQLLDCVEHVRKGSIWVGPEETVFLLEAIRRIPLFCTLAEPNSQTLSMRELQVVRAAANGKTNKTIANDLNLSEHTIKNYLFRAFEKLGVSSRVELLFYLTMQGHTLGPVRSAHEITTAAG
jgi:two-component system, NarL family, nitrate/nitrite response regulator NarL